MTAKPIKAAARLKPVRLPKADALAARARFTGGGKCHDEPLQFPRGDMKLRLPYAEEQRLRNAAWWTRRSITDVVREALVDYLTKLEKDENGGKAFGERSKGAR